MPDKRKITEERMQMTRFILLLFVALIMLAAPATSFGQISVSITVGPPALPAYEQPVCPGDGYIWTQGYWAYGDDDYYWVPATWVEAPEVGLLWTPAIGVGMASGLSSMRAIGVHRWASMAASLTAMAISAGDSKADDGTTGTSSNAPCA
jgi:hypothetical protein